MIGVMNDRRSSLLQRHIQGVDQCRLEMGRHRPPHNPTAISIQHNGQIQKAGPRRDIGNIRDPQLIPCARGKIALHEIDGGTCGLPRCVVWMTRRRWTPTSFAARIKRATRLRPM